MFIIKDTVTGLIHREPTRAAYRSKTYKSARAAKAGITRTLKYYQKAIQSVTEAEAQGKPAFSSNLYNAYKDATDPVFGRTHCDQADSYEVMTLEEYGDPQRTDTGRCPYNGKIITRTIGINEAWTHMDPLCESHWTR